MSRIKEGVTQDKVHKTRWWNRLRSLSTDAATDAVAIAIAAADTPIAIVIYTITTAEAATDAATDADAATNTLFFPLIWTW